MKRKRIKNNFLKFLNRTTTSDSAFNYGLIYGLFSIIIVLLKQVFSIIFLDKNLYVNETIFWFMIIYMSVLFILLIVIHIRKIPSTNKFADWFIRLYPYFFVALGLLIVFAYRDYMSGLLSFVAIAFVVFWIQIYNLAKRTLVFFLTSSGFIFFSFLRYGQSEEFSNNISVGIMAFLLMFISSTIIHQIHHTHQTVIKEVKIQNENVELQKQNLLLVQDSLSKSKRITEAMLGLTQEVLESEKIENVLQLVLDKTLDIIPHAQSGSILMEDDDSEYVKFVAASGYDLKALQRISLRKDETFQSILEDKYEPFVVHNIEVFNEAKIGNDEKDKQRNMMLSVAKSCLTCSFKYNDMFFGSINIDNFDSENAFTNDDKYLMKQLAKEIEIIISVHKLYEKATRPTRYDDLTQAKTRRYCIRLLNETIARNPNQNVIICMIDINYLKNINDQFGHDAGDRYLFEFAEATRNAISVDHIFGRMGGDEFLLIFENQTEDVAKNQIQKIRDYLTSKPFKVNDSEQVIEFACGTSIYTKDSDDIDELIKLSDKRMYIDKKNQK